MLHTSRCSDELLSRSQLQIDSEKFPAPDHLARVGRRDVRECTLGLAGRVQRVRLVHQDQLPYARRLGIIPKVRALDSRIQFGKPGPRSIKVKDASLAAPATA